MENKSSDSSGRDIHGFEGPIKVSFGNHTYPIAQDFLRAAETQGIPTTDDLQDLVTAQYENSILFRFPCRFLIVI